MDAVRLSTLTTLGTIAVAGLAAGHLLLPYAPPAPIGGRLAFWAIVLAVGAFRGWRDAVVRDARGARVTRRILLTALASAVAALAAYWLVHGAPNQL
jgi:hypothetical protein